MLVYLSKPVINFNKQTPSYGVSKRADVGAHELPTDNCHRNSTADHVDASCPRRVCNNREVKALTGNLAKAEKARRSNSDIAWFASVRSAARTRHRRALRALRSLVRKEVVYEYLEDVQDKGWRSAKSYKKACKKYWAHDYARPLEEAFCYTDSDLFSDITTSDDYTGTHGGEVLELVDHFIYTCTSEYNAGWVGAWNDIEGMEPEGGDVREESNVPDIDAAYSYAPVEAVYDQYENVKRASSTSKNRTRDSRKRSKPVPQGGVGDTISDHMASVSAMLGSMVDDKDKEHVLKHIERMLILLVGLSYSENAMSISMHLAQYVSSISDKSLSVSVFNWLSTLFNDGDFDALVSNENLTEGQYLDPSIMKDFDPKSFNLVPEGGTTLENIIEGLKCLNGNISLLSTNPAFQKISYLISTVACLGFCESSKLKWSIGGITLFAPNMFQKHVHATDLLSAVMDTLVYFFEGGAEFFKTGSFAGFLYSDSKVRSLQEKFNFLRSNAIHLKTGMLEKNAGISVQDYDRELEVALDLAKRLASSVSGSDRIVVDRIVTALFDLRAEFTATRVAGGIRAAPYTIVLHGHAGGGKSTLSGSVGHLIGLWNGFDGGIDRTITRRSDDKYDSNMKGYVTIVILEDVFNTAIEFLQSSPSEAFIIYCNNQRAYANMAEAELKGKVAIEPKVVIATTNVKDTGAHVASNCPVSITRRSNVTVKVSPKREFMRDGSNEMDSEKIEAHYAALNKKTPALADIFLLDVERPISVPNKVSGAQRVPAWVPYHDADGPMMGIGVHRFLAWLKEDTKKWFSLQERLVERVNGALNDISLCSFCGMLDEGCSCCVGIRNNLPCLDAIEESSESISIANSVLTANEFTHCSSVVYDEDDDETQYAPYDEADVIPPEPIPQFDPGMQPEGGRIDPREYHISLSSYILNNSLFTDPCNLWRDIVLIFRYCSFDVKRLTTDVLLKVAVDNRIDIMKYTPNWFFEILLARYLNDSISPLFDKDVLRSLSAFLFFVVVGYFNWSITPKTTIVLIILSFIHFLRWYMYVDKVNFMVNEEIISRNDLICTIATRVKMFNLSNMKKTSVVLAALYVAYKTYKSYVRVMLAQSALMPSGPDDINKRDAQKNVYQRVSPIGTISSDRRLLTSTIDHVVSNVFNNMCVMRLTKIVGDKTSHFCNAVFLESNIALVPKHMLVTSGNVVNELKARFQRREPDVSGGFFNSYVDSGNSVLIKGTDFALVSIPSGGDFRDIRHLLPSCPLEGQCKFIYKKPDGSRRLDTTTITYGSNLGHIYCKFPGYYYNLEGDTHAGLCMGALVRTSTQPQVAGFHLAGNKVKDSYGVAGLLTRAQYDQARSVLEKKVVVPHSSSDIPTALQNTTFIFEGDVHPKCPAHYMDSEASGFQVVGPCGGANTFKSRVEVSLMSESVENILGVPNIWGPPRSSPSWKPYYDALEKLAHGSIGFLPNDVKLAVDDYVKPIEYMIGANDYAKDMIRPLNHVQVVNGQPGVRFIDCVNKRGAIGPPCIGPKSRYLEPIIVEGYDEPVEFTADVMKHVEYCRKIWATGKRAYAPLKAFIKDEPTKLSKDKTRMIYAANVALQYEGRRLGCGVTRFIQHHPILCESMVGINAVSREWDEWVKYAKSDGFGDRDGKPGCFACDYSAYDSRMPAQILWAAGQVLLRIMTASGNYSEEDMTIFVGFLTEVIYPMVAFNGTMFILSTSHTSGGTSMVVILNNIANSLLKRVAFINIELKPRGLLGVMTFRDADRCANYGDDCKSSVNLERVLHWNMVTFAHFMEAHGMKVTMPNKTDELVPFMPWDEAEFLKRKDNYIPEIDCIVGALDLQSVFKSLHCNIRSKSISKIDHAVAVMQSAAYEIWPHGRAVYDDIMPKLRLVAKECGLSVPGLDKSFDDKVVDWQQMHNTDNPEITSSSNCEAEIEVEPEGGILEDTAKQKLCEVACKIGLFTREAYKPGICNYCLGEGVSPQRDPIEDVLSSSTETFYVSSSSSSDLLIPESGAEMVGSPSAEQPVTSFSDYNAGFVYNMGDMSDVTRAVTDESDLSLSKFLERPVLLFQTEWPVGLPLSQAFNPWELFLTQPRVANRISNYRNFRGRMHIRVLINGNPFYYGLGMLNYVPFGSLGSPFVPAVSGDNGTVMLASQNPHLYLDPTNSVGGEMTLPFWWQYNSLDLTGDQMSLMGFCYLRDIVDLQHSNGSLTGVTVSVMAWMSDVSLSGATGHNIDALVPQGGTDEYGQGIISMPANVIARMAGAVTAPAIKPYARATEMVATGVSMIAKAFGYSRPNNVCEVNPIRPTYFGNLANANLGDACQKLTFDAKQEVTIDPRVAGIMPTDEMSIVELAKRESYVTQFGWSTLDSVGSPLHYHLVTPVQFQEVVTAGYPGYYMTPSCWVAYPFKYWRGSLMFRFKVVASNFHKGRLRISYDPLYSLSSDDFNVVQNHIVDIAESKDFCMKIGWNSPKAYLEVQRFSSAVPFGPDPIITSGDTNNGGIRIEVLNQLTSPSNGFGAAVRVIVFVSACDDFEVQSPDSLGISPMTYFREPAPGLLSDIVPEGGIEALGESGGMDGAPCMMTSDCDIAPSLEPTDNTPGIFFGESPVSWRQCLKRYNYHSAMVAPGNGIFNATRPMMPSYRGYSPDGVHYTNASIPYNYCDMTLINWLLPAYAGFRGGMRYKIGATKSSSLAGGILHVTRSAGRQGWSEQSFPFTTGGNIDTSGEASFFLRKYFSHSWPGSSTTAYPENPVVEFEVPFHDNRRFYNARRIDYDVANTELPGYRVEFMSTSTSVALQQFVAVAEDFSLLFFLNTPIVYYNDVDPNPLGMA